MADIHLQDVVKIYGVSKNQKKHRQIFFKKEKTIPTKRAVDDVTLTIPHGAHYAVGCRETLLFNTQKPHASMRGAVGCGLTV